MENKSSPFQNVNALNKIRITHVFDKYFWIGPLLLSILIYLITTRYGIGLSPDSIAYLGSAWNLNNGSGFSLPYGLPPNQPLTQFPPLLPVILVLISKTGIPLILAAKLLNLLLVISFVILANLTLQEIDNRNPFFRLSVLSLVSVFAVVQFIFNMLWSEPLMIVLGFAAFLVFFNSQKYNNFYHLVLSGILFGLTVSARYAGVTFLATAMLIVFFIPSNNWKKKIYSWIALSAPTAIFLYFWMTRETGNAISSTGRVISFHPFNISHIHQILSTVGQWFLVPNSAHTVFKLVATLLFVGFVLLSSWFVFFSRRLKDRFIEKILIIFVYIYCLFVFFSITFLDANIPLDTRILSPVLFSVLLLVLIISKIQNQNITSTNRITYLISILITVFMVGILIINIPVLKNAFQNGIGFNSVTWKRYESIKYLNNLPQDHFLISNAPEPVFYYTNNVVFSFPKQYLTMQQEQNANYESEINQLISNYLKEKTYFIFFHKIKGGSESDIASFQKTFNLMPEKVFEEASIFLYIPRK